MEGNCKKINVQNALFLTYYKFLYDFSKTRDMQEFEQLLVHQFSNKLRQNFQQYCDKHNISQSQQTLISYLIDKGLLKTSLIRKYTILEEFKELYPSTNFHKTQTIKLLSERFNLSDRSIWSIIKADASKPNE